MNNLTAGKNKFILGLIVLISVGVIVFYLNDKFTPKEQIQEIVINSCSSINPSSISIINDKVLMFINEDIYNHTIKIGGKSFGISAGESQRTSSKFAYGAGSYLYDCDAVTNAGQIVINEGDVQSAAVKTEFPSFKSWYVNLNEDKKSCIKKVLAGDFEKAVDNPEFIPSEKAIKNVDECLAPKIVENK